MMKSVVGLSEGESAIVGGDFPMGEDSAAGGSQSFRDESKQEPIAEDTAGESDGGDVMLFAQLLNRLKEEIGECVMKEVSECVCVFARLYAFGNLKEKSVGWENIPSIQLAQGEVQSGQGYVWHGGATDAAFSGKLERHGRLSLKGGDSSDVQEGGNRVKQAPRAR